MVLTSRCQSTCAGLYYRAQLNALLYVYGHHSTNARYDVQCNGGKIDKYSQKCANQQQTIPTSSDRWEIIATRESEKALSQDLNSDCCFVGNVRLL